MVFHISDEFFSVFLFWWFRKRFSKTFEGAVGLTRTRQKRLHRLTPRSQNALGAQRSSSANSSFQSQN